MFFYLFILVGLYYLHAWYDRRRRYYSQGLTGPYTLPIFANTLHILWRPFADYEASNFKKYKRTYVDYILDPNGVITTSDPELIKKILIKDFHNFSYRLQPNYLQKYARKSVIFLNEDWKRVRSQVTPVFSSGRLKQMFKNFHHGINNCAKNIDELIGQNKAENVDIKKLMRAFTLDIIANVVFSMQINSFRDDDDFSEKVSNLFATNRIEVLFLIITPKRLSSWLGLSFMKQKTCRYFANLTLSLIEQRKQNKDVVYNDFIEMLLKSEAEEAEVKSNFKEDGHINKKLTSEELVAQCYIFFIAGMETVSTSLSMLLYELAIHQDVQDKLHKDLIACYPNDEITYEDLNKSNYLECVINETLRKHTTLSRIFRTAINDYDFGDFKVQKGQTVGVSLYNLHNDPAIYQDPHKFRPERFENGEVDLSLPVHIPFVDGPRNCIGNRFAMIEMKALVIKLIKNYRVFATDKTHIPLKVRKTVILHMVEDVSLGFEKRQ